MQIELISEGSYRRTLKVTADALTVKKELDKAYRDLGKRARLRGFRPGKAPRKVLEARFGPQVTADVAQEIIQRAYTDGLQQHSLEPVSRPRVERDEDPAPGQDFHFEIAVEVKPQIALETYTGIDVAYPKADVEDDELQQALEQRLQQSRRLVEVDDRPVEAGDQVMVELRVKDGEEEVAYEPGTMVQTGGDAWYTGVEELIVGMSKDEEKEGEVTFADSARTESVAGKTLQAQAKVLSIQAYEVPELTDELAEELGFEGGAEGMRMAVRAELQSGRDEMARNQARANLLQAIIDSNTFDVPSGLVDAQLEELVNELRMQQAYRGVDPRQVNFSEAQLADLRVRSEFAVKGGLILEFVTREHGIEVTDEDIDRKIAELADQRGQDPEAIRSYFTSDEGSAQLKDRLLEEKALDWLLENANIVDEIAFVESEAPAEDEDAAEADAAEAPAAEESEAAEASGDVPSEDDIDAAERDQVLAWAESVGWEPKGRTDKLKRELKKHWHG